ncbi:MAG: ACT domain-containing protein [Candidatus Hecatellales archaeon]|nr:MAG: ACT domain-containing protein [Candidatus Hecatellales archaeon]
MEKDDRVVIVAVGKDKPGLIAGVTSIISELNGNIEDMDQVVLQEVFIMSLIVRFLNLETKEKIERLMDMLNREGEKLGLKVHVYPLSRL